MKTQSPAKQAHNYFDQEEANLDYADLGQVQDRQYDQLLPAKKGSLSSMSYFRNAHKYAGRAANAPAQNQHDQLEDSKQEQDGMEEQEERKNGIKQALAQIKSKRRERSMLLEEDLKAIDQEDQQNLLSMKKNEKAEGDPEALQNQLNEFSKLAEVRYYSQKNMEEMKRFPTRNYPVSESLHSLHKQAQKLTLKSLQAVLQNYEKLAADFFTKQNLQVSISSNSDVLQCSSLSINTHRLNVEALWEKFQQQTKELNQKMEEEIVNWSQRTTLLRNSASKSQYNSLLMQTPIGQAKKAITDWDKVSRKCQQKRAPIKILFETEQNLRETADVNIYDDIDLLQEVQKFYQQELEKDDKDFLINDTLKYLESRNKTKVVKDVDRKASKNRKIRYNVHPKLLNFMPSAPENLLEARDEIVRNLFNKGGAAQEEAVDYIDI